MADTLGEAEVDVREQLSTLMAKMQEQSVHLQTLENENEEVRMENRYLRERVDSQSTLEQAPRSSSRAPTQRVLSFDTPPVAPAVGTGSRVSVGYDLVAPPSHHAPSFPRSTPSLEAVAVDPNVTPATTRVTFQGVPHPPPVTYEDNLVAPNHGATQEELVERLVSQRMEEVERLIRRIPGVPAPALKSHPDSYADSPFVDSIALAELHRKVTFPKMKPYDGTSDPVDHIAFYKQQMFTVSVPYESREACMCKGFGSSLSGPALRWYTSLPNGSIASFAQLVDMFVEQYASSRKVEKTSDDLYRLRQGEREPLRSYVKRFNEEKVSITNCNADTAITAFRRGLLVQSDLYKELTKYPCQSMEDVLAKARAQIKWEDDEAYRMSLRSSARSRVHDDQAGRKINHRSDTHRPAPYFSDRNKPQQQVRDIQQGRSEQRSSQPRGNDTRSRGNRSPPAYPLAIATSEVIAIMKEMGSQVKWPEKSQTGTSDGQKDTSRWCEFHRNHGHTTEQCIALRYEVLDLLKRGHLKQFLTDKGNAMLAASEKRNVTPPAPPPHARTINVIIGGSEINGLTYSAAKRHAQEMASITVDRQATASSSLALSPSYVLSFADTEADSRPHHDALVISVYISNCLTKRVLVDSGSSTNVLFLRALKEMEIAKSSIVRKKTMLVGFSGEQTFSLGEILLHVYVEGVSLSTKFLVVDSPSPYNAILGRPWIHDMKAVPSTYHQVIRFPTKWGVKEIYGTQQAARDCYQNALKKGSTTAPVPKFCSSPSVPSTTGSKLGESSKNIPGTRVSKNQTQL